MCVWWFFLFWCIFMLQIETRNERKKNIFKNRFKEMDKKKLLKNVTRQSNQMNWWSKNRNYKWINKRNEIIRSNFIPKPISDTFPMVLPKFFSSFLSSLYRIHSPMNLLNIIIFYFDCSKKKAFFWIFLFVRFVDRFQHPNNWFSSSFFFISCSFNFLNAISMNFSKKKRWQLMKAEKNMDQLNQWASRQ